MMEKLPVEILKMIFKPLHQEDKAQCMLLCRSLKHAIKNTILFNTIRLYSKEQFDKLVDIIRLEPENGDRVENLIIEAKKLKKADINTLLSLLPNIREVTLVQNFGNEKPQSRKTRHSQPWKKTIKTVVNIHNNFPIYHILKGDQCPSLTEIQINGRNKDPTAQLIENLGNAPNLKVLTLLDYEFTLLDLEALHNNVPLLESLTLVTATINAPILPIDIKPANKVKNLTLSDVSTWTDEMTINFESYLTKKYTCIVHLGVAANIHTELNLEGSMNRGFASQIQQFGSHLTSLEYINQDGSFQFLFPILDQIKCKINRMFIMEKLRDSDFQQITDSNQVRYIQTLSCTLFSCSTIINYFHKLTALTDLTLSFAELNTDVNMSNLMDVIGDQLEALRLGYSAILLDMSFSPLCSKLKKLNLQYSRLPPGFDTFISHTCPNLRNLVLNMCTWDSQEFCMENLSLSYLEIRMKLPKKNDHVLITTTSNNEKHWYTTKRETYLNPYPVKDLNIYPNIKSIPFDKYNGDAYKTFICKSLYEFHLVNCYR